MKNNSLAGKMEKHRVLITNSRNEEVAPYLLNIGIDTIYLDAGDTLLADTDALIAAQKKEYQEKDQAYDDLQAASSVSVQTAKDQIETIKILSRNDEGLQDRLGINDPRKRRIEDWILQTIQFYDLLQNETAFLEKLTRFSLTAEKLTASSQAISDLKILRDKAMAEKGEAQEATRVRNEKIHELEDYCYELESLAKIALKNKPQLLEMLGVLVRS